MMVSEIFETIQGEGPLMGRPMLFIRLSGCNLSCEWCDTKYAQEDGKEVELGEVVDAITQSDLYYVCWTGGEPLLQVEDILMVTKRTMHKGHCLETNGTLNIPHGAFDSIVVSPKDLDTAPPSNADYLKFVTLPDDFNDIVSYVERHSIEREKVFIQPLCREGTDILKINKELWKMCVKEGFSLSPRLHIMMFGMKRGV